MTYDTMPHARTVYFSYASQMDQYAVDSVFCFFDGNMNAEVIFYQLKEMAEAGLRKPGDAMKAFK